MLSWFGRSTARFCSGSSCTIKHRVELIPSTFSRASACFGAEASPYLIQSNRSIASRSIRRAYATKPVSRPKAHTGRTTSFTRKRKPKTVTDSTDAVTSQKPEKPTNSDTKVGQPKKRASKRKTKAAAAKKPSTKKKRVKKEKVLTEDQEKQKKIRELSKLVLKRPKKLPDDAWKVFLLESFRELPSPTKISALTKEASGKYKNFTPADLEHYNHLANANKRQNEEAYQKWITSFTPSEIKDSNNIVIRLRRLGVTNNKLQDSRQIKRPRNSMSYYVSERSATGDYKGMRSNDRTRLIATEWNSLSAQDKQKYIEASRQDKERYAREKVAFDAASTA